MSDVQGPVLAVLQAVPPTRGYVHWQHVARRTGLRGEAVREGLRYLHIKGLVERTKGPSGGVDSGRRGRRAWFYRVVR